MNPTDSSPAKVDELRLPGGSIWFRLCLISFAVYVTCSEGLRGHVAFLIRAVRKVLEHLA
jgi:hypothetical protein